MWQNLSFFSCCWHYFSKLAFNQKRKTLSRNFVFQETFPVRRKKEVIEVDFTLDFSGGIIAYSSPVPDLLGASNITSEQILWEEQSHGLLTDGNYGLQDINVNKILTYGEYVMVHVSALENILILWKKALFYVKEYGTHFWLCGLCGKFFNVELCIQLGFLNSANIEILIHLPILKLKYAYRIIQFEWYTKEGLPIFWIINWTKTHSKFQFNFTFL